MKRSIGRIIIVLMFALVACGRSGETAPIITAYTPMSVVVSTINDFEDSIYGLIQEVDVWQTISPSFGAIVERWFTDVNGYSVVIFAFREGAEQLEYARNNGVIWEIAPDFSRYDYYEHPVIVNGSFVLDLYEIDMFTHRQAIINAFNALSLSN